jgi:hypothetical protein
MDCIKSTQIHFRDWLPTVITSRRIELEFRGWSQIVEEKKIFSGLMCLLKYDSNLLMILQVQAKKQLKIVNFILFGHMNYSTPFPLRMHLGTSYKNKTKNDFPQLYKNVFTTFLSALEAEICRFLSLQMT